MLFRSAEDDPTVQLVDAGLLLASGLPEKALGRLHGLVQTAADL